MPADIISEIRNSAAAGLEITAHEQPVNFYGSSQVGYVILDPATGAGAYKIGGGENGGDIIIATLTGGMSFLSLLFGLDANDPAPQAGRGMYRLLSKTLGIISNIISLVSTLMSLWESCKGADLVLNITLYLILFAAIAAIAALLSSVIANPLMAFVAVSAYANYQGALLSSGVNTLKLRCQGYDV